MHMLPQFVRCLPITRIIRIICPMRALQATPTLTYPSRPLSVLHSFGKAQTPSNYYYYYYYYYCFYYNWTPIGSPASFQWSGTDMAG